MEEGAFTMVARRKKDWSPKRSHRPGMEVAICNPLETLQEVEDDVLTLAAVDPIPSPLMVIEGMGGQGGPMGDIVLVHRDNISNDPSVLVECGVSMIL